MYNANSKKHSSMNLSVSRQEILPFAPARWNVFESGHPQSIGSKINTSKMQGSNKFLQN